MTSEYKYRKMLKATNSELQDTLKVLGKILKMNSKASYKQIKIVEVFYPLLMKLSSKIHTIEEVIKEVE